MASDSPPRGSRARSDAAQQAQRDNIVQAARELFEHQTFESVSLRAIARAVKLTPGALYTYFPNKLSLLRAVWSQDLLSFQKALEGFSEDAGLLEFSCFFVDYWLDHPRMFKVLFLIPDTGDDQQRMFVDTQQVAALLDVVRGQVFAAMPGIADERCRETEFRAFLCALYGVINMRILVPELHWDNTTEMVRTQVAAFLGAWS